MQEIARTRGTFGVGASLRTNENRMDHFDLPIVIQHSPPLTYENTREHLDGVDRSFACDLAPTLPPGVLSLSVTSNPLKVPLSGRNRPLPTPFQPKTSPASGQPAFLSQSATPNSQCPPVALNNPRRRPLPQPGVLSIAALPFTPPSSSHLPSSHSSSILSSSHSRSASSNSNTPSLCTSSSYSHLHSSSYQTSFISSSRASTLPALAMKASRDQAHADRLTLPRRGDTQPSSAPPCSGSFNIIAPTAPQNPKQTSALRLLKADAEGVASVKDGQAKAAQSGNGDKNTEHSKGSVKMSANHTGLAMLDLEDFGVLPAVGTTTATTSEAPLLPALDFATQISPMPTFFEFKSEPSGAREKTVVVDQAMKVDNALGLSGMKEEKLDYPTTEASQVPPVLPPPPAVLPPVPPAHEKPQFRSTARAPVLPPVPLRPLNGTTSTARKNRPVLTIRTWDLDPKPKPKKEPRQKTYIGIPLPTSHNEKGLEAPSMNKQSRSSIHSSGASKRMHQDNSNSKRAFLSSTMGHGAKKACADLAAAAALTAPLSGDTAKTKEPGLSRPSAPAPHELLPAKPSGGVLATQLRKMKLLHRKSKSFTDLTLSIVDDALQGPSEGASGVLPGASLPQNRSFLPGYRQPYGYQPGVATRSLTSVGASMPTASGSSMVYSDAPRPKTLYSGTPEPIPASLLSSQQQPKRSPPPRTAPLPPTPNPAELKKAMSSLWAKLRFGSSRKMTNTMPKKSIALDLW